MINLRKRTHELVSKTFIGELILRLKPSIKKDLVLLLVVFCGGYLGYKLDLLMLGLEGYGRTIVIGYFTLLGYAIRVIQIAVINKIGNDE